MMSNLARKGQVGVFLVPLMGGVKTETSRVCRQTRPGLLLVMPCESILRPTSAWEDEDDLGYSPEDLYDNAYSGLEDDEDLGPYEEDEDDLDDDEDDFDYEDDYDDFDEDDYDDFDEDEDEEFYEDLEEDEL